MLQLPRPTQPVQLELVGLSGFSIQAVSSGEYHDILMHQQPLRELILRVLRRGDAPAFDAESIGWLSEAELKRCVDTIDRHLGHISPLWSHSDTTAWRRTLRAGAEHLSNLHTAIQLGTGTASEYFGVAPCNLVDAHSLAHSVCRDLLNDLRERNE
jgi:hypothetical protein